MRKYLKILFSLFFSIILLLAFALPLNPAGNWYQQFLPNLNNEPISDIYFLDSLTGFAVTGDGLPNDSGYILKTTDSGDSWVIKYRAYRDFYRVKFINQTTGFACGGFNSIGQGLFKTINAGENWTNINAPGSIWFEDMSVLSEDTIWLVLSSSLDGGVFRTTNGGGSWEQQFSGGNQNPNKIYMYNARIGFMSNNSASPNIYKTTNSGVNWNVIVSNDRFLDMHFVDSLTGWRTRGDTLKFTSNGGINWTPQLMPYGGLIFSSRLLRFSVLNKDTLWGCGGYVLYPNSRVKSIIYRTTNGGINWLYQIPDTNLLPFESYIEFSDKKHGWLYSINQTGIHTNNGGDAEWITGIKQINSQIPVKFKLYQNYPNPFNPKTIIRYQIMKNNSEVLLSVYDITGKHMIDLVNQNQTAGTYETDFSGNTYSSGVYFYQLTVTAGKDVYSETKKMLLIK